MSTFDSNYHHILPSTSTTTSTDFKNFSHLLRRFSSSSTAAVTHAEDSPSVLSHRNASSASIAMSYDNQGLDVYNNHHQHQQQQQHQSTSPTFSFNAPTGRFLIPPPTPACELSQWITTTTTNSPVQPIHAHFPPPPSSTSTTMSGSLSSTSTGTTASSFPPSPDMYGDSGLAANPYSLPTSASCLTINPNPQPTHWSNSNPTTSTSQDMYAHMLLSPMESAGVYNGFATLALGGDMGVSPKDVMASSTMVDADEFGVGSPLDYPVVGGGAGGGGYGTGTTGFSPPAMFDFDFNTGGVTAANSTGPFGAGGGYASSVTRQSLFGGQGSGHRYASPPSATSLFHPDIPPSSSSFQHQRHMQQQQQPQPQTQFPLDLDFDLEEAQQTIRPTNAMGRPGLFGGDGWNGPSSAPVTGGEFDSSTVRRKSTSTTTAAMRSYHHHHHHHSVGSLPVKVEEGVVSMDVSMKRQRRPSRLGGREDGLAMEDGSDEEDDEDDEEEEDDEDGDGDYVDDDAQLGRLAAGGQQHTAGVHRIPPRRHSHSTHTSNAAPVRLQKRGSPYSRPGPSSSLSSSLSSSASRPRASSTTTANMTSPTTVTKKPKAVKWESTKPKYWIPEGFDPWWDQKSRGRGVEAVSASLSTSSSLGSSSSGGGGDGGWAEGELPEDWKELVRGRGNPGRPFVCPAVNCGKTFQRSEHAKRHASSLHTPDAVKVPCPYEGCDHKSTRGDNLKQHIDSHRRKRDGVGAGTGASSRGNGKKRRSVKYEDDD